MINVSSFQSNAIILLSSSPPVLVALPGMSPNTLKTLLSKLQKGPDDSSKDIVAILRFLWTLIVQPVVNELASLKVPEKSHIEWGPTSYLLALPLHAAGPYRKGHKNLPDLYVSSYTSTLTSLIQARSEKVDPLASLKILLVSQPDTTIPKVFNEAEII
jgi:hypothetical protein